MKKTILVCDDDVGVRRVLSRLLSTFYTVVEALDGRDALRLIVRRTPDLILLDVAMPGLGGIQALQVYSRTHPHVPTVILTGHCELEIARRALDLGARAYVTKPFSTALLLDEVHRILVPEASAVAAGDVRPPWRVKLADSKLGDGGCDGSQG